MKTTHQTRRGFTLVELLVVIVIIAALAGLTAPMVIRQRKKADQTEALSNARQIGLALFEFETEYGTFPEGSLGTQINENTGSELATSTIANSNDAFRMLIAAGIASSETMFYCKTAYSTVKPDNIFNTKEAALRKGEVGFGYIMGPNSAAFSTAGNPGRPIIAAPLQYTGSFAEGKFDKDMYDSKAVILKIDNSAVSLTVNKDNEAILGGGKKILQTGDGTVWGTDARPQMVNPDPK
ncbi:MAG: prepilin-type N-terminal cleavage/methylation domain-containing protein [Verrucomicrobiaceae bacterium]|nr:MAG: prepilin-type N-terminal cleavage/methylation domain-containing protein [Verrucomicrobiaceae bacterium]